MRDVSVLDPFSFQPQTPSNVRSLCESLALSSLNHSIINSQPSTPAHHHNLINSQPSTPAHQNILNSQPSTSEYHTLINSQPSTPANHAALIDSQPSTPAALATAHAITNVFRPVPVRPIPLDDRSTHFRTYLQLLQLQNQFYSRSSIRTVFVDLKVTVVINKEMKERVYYYSGYGIVPSQEMRLCF